MGMRKETRLRLALPVRVSGENADGESFEQNCTTVDLTAKGLRIEGLTQILRCGAVISVSYGAKSAPAQVRWTGKTGAESQGHAGLQLVGGWNNLWGRAIPSIPGDKFSDSTNQYEVEPDSKLGRSDDSGTTLLDGRAADAAQQDAEQGQSQLLSFLPRVGLLHRLPREPRLKLQLPVRVCGMSKTGQPFVDNAVTENVSRSGARLAGLTCEVRKYDVLILSHQDRKARFRVIWSRNHGSRPEFEVGLRALELSQNIWATDFSGARDECAPVERRVALRYICGGAASIWHPGAKYFVRGTVTDVSLTGCYVAMMVPLAVHDRVVVMLDINGTEVRTSAEVRTSHPGIGMGLKFSDLAETDQSSLRALISRLGDSGSYQIDFRAEGRDRKEVRETLDKKPVQSQTTAIFDCATVQSAKLAGT
jgi:hypothetical protein